MSGCITLFASQTTVFRCITMRRYIGFAVLFFSALFAALDFYIPNFTDIITLKDVVCIKYPFMKFAWTGLCPQVDHSYRPALNASGQKDGCIFCNILHSRREHIVHEDDDLVAFHDINPSGEYHYLVIPKRHIGTYCSLKIIHD